MLGKRCQSNILKNGKFNLTIEFTFLFKFFSQNSASYTPQNGFSILETTVNVTESDRAST